MNTDGTDFKYIKKYVYLDKIVTERNKVSKEIPVGINKRSGSAAALDKSLKNKSHSIKRKLRTYNTIICAVVTCGCELWTTTLSSQRKLPSLEDRLQRKMCGPVDDNLSSQ